MQLTVSSASAGTASHSIPTGTRSSPPDLRAALGHALDHAGQLLPDQGPLEVFVHHNTLHAFQHMPFHEGLRAAHRCYHAQVYRSEPLFRRDLNEGRIDSDALEREIDRYFTQHGLDPDEELGGLCSRRMLYALALRHDLVAPARAALRWRVREQQFDRRLAAMDPSDIAATITRGRTYLQTVVAEASLEQLARRFLGPHPEPERMVERYSIPLEREAILRSLAATPEPLVAGAMWQACRTLARSCPRRPSKQASERQTHRDVIRARTGVDLWRQTDPELQRWAAAYLDEGLAYWPMPLRERGFYLGVRELMTENRLGLEPWKRRAIRILADQRERELTAEDACVEVLTALGLTADEPGELQDYVLALLFTNPGFGGMFSRLQRHPHERGALAPPTSLLDLCAFRLVLEQAALEQAAVDHRLGELRTLERRPRSARAEHPDADAAYRLFLLAQKLGLSPAELDTLTPADAATLLDALDQFDELDRCRVFLEAYERCYRDAILAGMRAIRPSDPGMRNQRPSAQYVTCFDDREESFRRHIEEVDPEAETFSAAGSFGLAIDYLGLDAGGHTPLAGAGVRPRHEIAERPQPGDSVIGEVRQSLRRRWGQLLHQAFFGSRSGFRGALASLLVGPFAWVPLSARVLAPRSSMRALDRLGALALPRPRTHLTNAESGEQSARGLAMGYTFEEQVDRVATLLEGMGLREHFAPLVLLLGHGSTSLNNPHEAAYDCGACGGRRGGATGRLLALFANDPRVRAEVAQRGIAIPDRTWFLAGEHDTSDDHVELFDVERVPEALAQNLAQVREVLDLARARNSHERVRKFEMAALTAGVDEGLRHVESRASHLAEPRPEYNHCTNAVCVIGRRSLTRGLFLDRRAFVLSYDPESDPNASVLEPLLVIAANVGSGINLEYYFSTVDPEVFGCGTKLPHNICGYIGVLNGTSGDLRTGLTVQMIEIHEPMRLQVIVEATPETLLEIAEHQPLVAELVTNGWIVLVSVDPRSGAMQLFEDGRFIPHGETRDDVVAPLAEASTSSAHYQGSREYLPPARIHAALGRSS